MSSLPAPHLFLFPLWQGMLTFQENSTSRKRTANTNNFLKVWFSWRLWFLSFWASGGLEGKKVSISLTRTSAWRMLWVLWPRFPSPLPLWRFWCETKWKALFMFSLGCISWGPGEGREASACSQHIPDRCHPWAHLHWQLLLVGRGEFSEEQASFSFPKMERFLYSGRLFSKQFFLNIENNKPYPTSSWIPSFLTMSCLSIGQIKDYIRYIFNWFEAYIDLSNSSAF